MKPEEFISLLAPAAQKYQQQHGIFASVTIAQAALETGWAKFIPRDKHTGKESFNLFGVKGEGPAGSVICDTQEWDGKKYITIEAQFAAYNSWEESLAGHNEVLLKPWYKPVRDATNWRAACMYLQSCGYATDPYYGAKLIRIIEEHQLYEYDRLPVPFPDVPLGHWAVPALTRLKEAGILVGREDGKYYGNDPVNRYEFAIALDALYRKLQE